jgi:hypothetical protein
VFSQIMEDALRQEHVPPTIAIGPSNGPSRQAAGTVASSVP